MKYVMALFFVVLLGLSVTAGYFCIEMRALSAEVQELTEANKVLEARLLKLEEQSISGVMEQAGEAIVDGWGLMLESVEDELAKAQKELDTRREQRRQQQARQQNQQPIQ